MNYYIKDDKIYDRQGNHIASGAGMEQLHALLNREHDKWYEHFRKPWSERLIPWLIYGIAVPLATAFFLGIVMLVWQDVK